MKVFVYNYRRFDEAEFFERYTKEFGLELGWTEDPPTADNCYLAAGSDFVSVITTPITPEMIDKFADAGIKMISTRTIGYDHIDLAHAKERGIAVAHITYDPEGVAEFAVMDILMAVRRLRNIVSGTMGNDFTLEGRMGGELKEMTVGVIGAGKIGRTVMRDLSGFGCKIIYWSRSENTEADRYGTYTSLSDLLSASDVITLHLELNGDTRHIIDGKAIGEMKDGAVLVNTARGPLVDTEALISALDSGKIGYAALDVVEGEFGLYYNDCRGRDLEDTFLGRLRKMPNVIITHHMAFYYRTAVKDMVYNCLLGMKMFSEGKNVPYRIV